MQLILEVVAAVISNNKQFLACRRSKDRDAGGKWEFPGGKVDPGETHPEALKRELREELDISIDVGPLVLRQSTVVGGITIDLSCYHARVLGPLPTQSSDHDEIRWVAASLLENLDWALPDVPAVEILATADFAALSKHQAQN